MWGEKEPTRKSETRVVLVLVLRSRALIFSVVDGTSLSFLMVTCFGAKSFKKKKKTWI